MLGRIWIWTHFDSFIKLIYLAIQSLPLRLKRCLTFFLIWFPTISTINSVSLWNSWFDCNIFVTFISKLIFWEAKSTAVIVEFFISSKLFESTSMAICSIKFTWSTKNIGGCYGKMSCQIQIHASLICTLKGTL